VREQARAGTTVIYISHALQDVLDLCDEITVLRDGRVVRTTSAARETVDGLVQAMIGRSLEAVFPPRRPPAPDAPIVLSVRGLSTAGWVRDVSFDVRHGEIVGLAGLIGSGRSEVGHAIAGAARAESGEIAVEGEVLRSKSPREAVRRGIAMLPESRKAQGLVLSGSVLDNVTLPYLRDFQRAGMVSRPRQEARVAELADQVGLKAPSLSAPVAALSGGNQQKVMFAKWLCRPPRVLIADEPTRGVDVAAKQAIYELLGGLAAQGLGILLISSELEEVLELSHRVLVMRQGELAGELDIAQADEQSVLHLAFGTTEVGDGRSRAGDGPSAAAAR
jgi:ABC-type sugar transport system ATPase subunit